VLEAARAFGLADDGLRLMPGATRQTWAAGPHVLRVKGATELAREIAACDAASAYLPVPRVLDLVALGTVSAALFEALPGTAAGDLNGVSPESANRRGLACGRVHTLLAPVPAPDVLPEASEVVLAPPGAPGPPLGDRLLHLDLHPFNVLVDERDEG